MRSCGIKMSFLIVLSFTIMGFILFNACQSTPKHNNEEEWIALFDGSNYTDWTPKFKGSELGVNYKDRFVYKDSLLSVRYTEIDTFKGNFGILFYKNKFSFYKLKAKYRFVGKQMVGAPYWAYRNNGFMLHSQEPESMSLNQDYPISFELLLLGGNGTDERATANLCTPGTNVVMNDSLLQSHCFTSTSNTYHGDQWVTVEALVLGDSLVRYIMEDQVVLAFNSPSIGGGNVEGYNESAYLEGLPLKEGYISIQAQSHPIDFESIELLNLCGCMDEKATNYKDYYVKADNSTCVYE